MSWLCAAAAVAILLPLAGCAETTFEPIPSAGWKPGYTFGFSGAGSVEFTGIFTVDGEVVETEDEREAFGPVVGAYRVVNATYREGDVPLYVAVAVGSLSGQDTITDDAPRPVTRIDPLGNGATLVAFRQSDLATMGLESLRTESCKDCLPEVSTVGFREPRAHHPWIRFPLVHGDTWKGVFGEAELGSDGIELASRVHGLSRMAGPEGEVDVVRITHTLRLDSDLFEEQVRKEAREEGVVFHSIDVDIRGDGTSYYAPSLHHAVMHDSTFRMEGTADFEEDGKRVQVEMSMRLDYKQVLAYVELVERPALPPARFGEALADPPGLPAPLDPNGPPPGPGGTLQLAGDKLRVNAAERPEVRFTTTATGTAKPDSYEVTDAAGKVVASGEGGDFTFLVQEPGNYVATVTGVDGNGKKGRARATLVADHVETVAETCPPASAFGLLACPRVTVPVRPGVVQVEVGVRHEGAVPVGGFLELEMADGTSYAEATQGGSATMMVEDAAPGDARLRFIPYVGVAEEVEYSMTLLHGDGDVTATAGARILRDLLPRPETAGLWSTAGSSPWSTAGSSPWSTVLG